MPDVDLFNFFRWGLSIVATIYATAITVQSLWSWYVWLATDDRYIGVLRRYLIVHGLRLRFSTFWGDVVISGLLCVAFLLLMRAHSILASMHAVILSQ